MKFGVIQVQFELCFHSFSQHLMFRMSYNTVIRFDHSRHLYWFSRSLSVSLLSFCFCICFTLDLVCLLGPIWFKGNPNAIQLICAKPDKQECPSRSCLVHKTLNNPLPDNGSINRHLAGPIPQFHFLAHIPKVFQLLWIFWRIFKRSKDFHSSKYSNILKGFHLF